MMDAREAIAVTVAGKPTKSVGDAYNIADAIVEALSLRQEWMVRHESGGGIVYDTYDEAKDRLDNFVERPPGVEDPGSGKLVGIETRYVSTWNKIEHGANQ